MSEDSADDEIRKTLAMLLDQIDTDEDQEGAIAKAYLTFGAIALSWLDRAVRDLRRIADELESKR